MHSILNAVKNRLDELGDDIAQGITDSDWKRVARGSSMILLMIAVILGLFICF